MIEAVYEQQQRAKQELLHRNRVGTPIETLSERLVNARHQVENRKMCKELGIPLEDLDK